MRDAGILKSWKGPPMQVRMVAEIGPGAGCDTAAHSIITVDSIGYDYSAAGQKFMQETRFILGVIRHAGNCSDFASELARVDGCAN